MNAQDQQSLLGDAVLILIVLSFLVIAFTFWLRVRVLGELAILMPRVAIAGLIMAALTGYVPRLLPIEPGLLMVMHVLMAVLAWWYALYGVIDLLDARRQSRPPDEPR